MAQIGENGRVGLLQDNVRGETTAIARGLYLVESVGKRFFCARGSTEDFPEIHG